MGGDPALAHARGGRAGPGSGSSDRRVRAAPVLGQEPILRGGRDLFDLWLALTVLGLRGGEIVSAFWPSRPDGLTAALAEANDTSIGSASLPTSMWPAPTGGRSWYASSSHARAWLPS